MRKWLFPLLTLTVLFSCHQPAAKNGSSPKPVSKDSVTGKLSVKNMQDDLLVLWSAIKEMHPAYGIYTPADSLQAAYDRTYASIDTPLFETEFISRIYPFLCDLRCGHTQIRHSAQYKASAEPQEPHLPFEVLVRHHHAWITTHETDKLNTGEEIIGINDIPVREIIDHGYGLYSGDGYNETFKELFLSEYDGFEDACYNYYQWMAPWRVTMRTKQGVTKTLLLDAPIAGSTLQPQPEKKTDPYAAWTESKNTDYLPLRFLKNSPTAWFEVKSYQYSDTLIYKEAFKQIHEKGIKNLIIDLRHNTGGDIRVAAKLLSFLADSSFFIIHEVKSRIANPAVNQFEKYFDSTRTESFLQGFIPGPQKGDYYHIDFSPAFGSFNGLIALDKTSHFHDNLFVLIDGATFSSGAHTAAAIKAQCKNVHFIGRETAGAEEGCSGGTIQLLTLPNTHIEVEFPWMRIVSVAKHPVFGHGIIPDHIVEYSPEEIVDKTDPDIRTALRLIK
jgi:hypothetical protein